MNPPTHYIQGIKNSDVFGTCFRLFFKNLITTVVHCVAKLHDDFVGNILKNILVPN